MEEKQHISHKSHKSHSSGFYREGNKPDLSSNDINIEQKQHSSQKSHNSPSSLFGTIYLQTGYYDENQMKNIYEMFKNDTLKAPKMLFGDNYMDKYRDKSINRKQYSGQAKIMGKWDRNYAFGIPTTFKYAKSNQFIYNKHNFSNLIKFEFDKLIEHIINGGDIIIPYPSKQDLEERRNTYFHHTSNKQVIHHNIGTGIASLPFEYLLIIQNNINKLKNYAKKTQFVQQKLYYNNINNNNNNDNNNNTDSNKYEYGTIFYQRKWINSEQLKNLCNDKYLKQRSPKILFGDNDIDKDRKSNEKRQFFGGQAATLGIYDRWIGYGITTTFYKYNNGIPSFDIFKNLMDKQFISLKNHLLNGYDIIIPSPTNKDIENNGKYKYYQNGQQVIKHNIGTGIAGLQFKYIQYIQLKINELNKYAKNTKYCQYYQIQIVSNKQYTVNGNNNNNNNNNNSLMAENESLKLKLEKMELELKENEMKAKLEAAEENRKRFELETKRKEMELKQSMDELQTAKLQSEKIKYQMQQKKYLQNNIHYAIKWEFEDKYNNKWISYDQKTSQKIQQLQLFKSFKFKPQYNKQTYLIKKLSETTGKQKNIQTATIRNVRQYIYKWEREGDKPWQWISYDTKLNVKIDELNKNQSFKFKSPFNNQQYQIIKIDANNAYQINTISGVKRKVRRSRK